MFDTVRQDLRIGARAYARTPGFTVTAVATLALGIGLSTAVFSVATTLLVRRLPVRDQDRVVVLWGQTRDHRYDNFPLFSLDETRDFSRRTRALARVAFFAREGAPPVPATIGTRLTRLRRSLVSGSFFDVLGATPVLGRVLRAEDDVLGAAPVAVLSYAGWRRQFDGDPRVIARRVRMFSSGFELTVVGVMPQGLDYPRGVEFWTPFVPATTTPGNDHPFVEVDVVGRLARGATEGAARDELTAFFARSGAPSFERDVVGVAHTLPALVLGDVKPAVVAFTVAVVLLLLITCINVANLLLIRGLGRTREIAVRSALGASQGRNIRQLLTESGMLAVAGGTLGAGIAASSVRLLMAIAPSDLPRLDEVHIGLSTLGMAILVAVCATLFFGIAPAVVSARRDVQEALRSGARQSGSRRLRRATEALVVGQVALALVVLAAAGLVGRSLVALSHVDLSFNPARLMIAELTLPGVQFVGKDRQVALLDRLLPRIEAIPGVASVSPVNLAPFSGAGIDFQPAREGQSAADAERNPIVNVEAVAPNYFTTLGIDIMSGRSFTNDDGPGSALVTVISRSLADRFWPGESAIGKRIKGVAMMTVVGIVPDTRYRDLRDARSSVYLPIRQSPFPFAPTTLAIRARGNPGAIVAGLRTAIGEVDPSVGLTSARTLDEILSQPLAHPRLNALLLAIFGAAALALAAVGLFGVMMSMVRQRAGELGVRMALGATASDIGRLVLVRGVTLAVVGTVLGLGAASVANNLLRQMLYGVSPLDPLALGLATGALLIVGTAAAFLPAVASGRIQPAGALRNQ